MKFKVFVFTLLLFGTFFYAEAQSSRPSPPGSIKVVWSDSEIKITLPGYQSGLLSEVSLLPTLSCPVTEGWRASASSEMVTIHCDLNLSGRFFIAAAFSKEDSSSLISGWKIWQDENGVPQCVSTAKDSTGEPFAARVRRISPTDPAQAVLDFSFSLPKTELDSAEVKVWTGSGTPRTFDLSSASVYSDIKEVMDNPPPGNNFILRAEQDLFYLYNMYMIYNDFDKDSIRIELTTGAGEVDTTEKHIRRAADPSYMDIHNTIYTLLCIPENEQDPVGFSGTLAVISDSLRHKLLITALLDRSLPHASPPADSLDVAHGVFTNYIQFMDRTVRSWGDLATYAPGGARLAGLHGKILEWNGGEVRDPVSVMNHGTVFHTDTTQSKRENYVFPETFSRVNWKLEKPDTASASGVGVLIRISENIELYTGKKVGLDFIFDEEPILSNIGGQQVIFSTADTLLDRLTKLDGGIWITAAEGFDPQSDEDDFHLGMDLMRMPLVSLHPAFRNGVPVVSTRSAQDRDARGKVVAGTENTLLKFQAVQGSDTLEEISGGELFLHGQKRKVVFNQDFMEEGSRVEFNLLGEEKDKVLMLNPTDSSVVLHDTSQFNLGAVGFNCLKWVGDLVTLRMFRKMASKTLVLSEAEDGVLERFQYVPKKINGKFVKDLVPVKVKIEQDTARHISEGDREKKKITIRRSSGNIDAYSGTPSNTIFGTGYFENCDYSGKHVEIRDWTSWSKIYQTDSLTISASSTGLDTVDFYLRDSVESRTIGELVELAAVNVSFDSTFVQSYGFDGEVEDEEEWVSVQRDSTTYVKLTVGPEIERKYRVSVSNPSIAAIPDAPKIIQRGGEHWIQIKGGDEGLTDLQVHGVSSGKEVLLKRMAVAVYERQPVDIEYFFVKDPRHGIDSGFVPIDTGEFRMQSDSVLMQAVAEIWTIAYDTCSIEYDVNGNGFLDFYYYEKYHNPELDSIINRNGIYSTNHVNKFCYTWILKDTLRAGSRYFRLENDLNFFDRVQRTAMSKTKFYIYRPDFSASEAIKPLNWSPAEDAFFLSTAVDSMYPKGSFVSLPSPSAGFMKEDIQRAFVFSNEAKRILYFTVLHENLHLRRNGALKDVISEGNLMHHHNREDLVNSRDLRYRGLTPLVDTLPDQFQWNQIRSYIE